MFLLEIMLRLETTLRYFNNVSIYEGVTLENDVFCGPSVVFTNVKFQDQK